MRLLLLSLMELMVQVLLCCDWVSWITCLNWDKFSEGLFGSSNFSTFFSWASLWVCIRTHNHIHTNTHTHTHTHTRTHTRKHARIHKQKHTQASTNRSQTTTATKTNDDCQSEERSDILGKALLVSHTGAVCLLHDKPAEKTKREKDEEMDDGAITGLKTNVYCDGVN